MNFKITDGKGFRMQFENGWSVSVQFGHGNYCDNYDRIFRNPGEAGEEGSNTAECAVFTPERNFSQPPGFDGDDVKGNCTPSEVLELLNWAAEQK